MPQNRVNFEEQQEAQNVLDDHGRGDTHKEEVASCPVFVEINVQENIPHDAPKTVNGPRYGDDPEVDDILEYF